MCRAAVSTVQGTSVQYMTWSLPQQALADDTSDVVAERDASQEESSGEDDTLLNYVGGLGGREEWDDLHLDDDESA
jgi:hypothetical protein